MKITKDKVIMKSIEYNDMIYALDKLTDKLNMYKEEYNMLIEKLHIERMKFYRNRKLFESFIDEIVLPIIDEDILKKMTNLTYKTIKEEIMKEYDKDIK